MHKAREVGIFLNCQQAIIVAQYKMRYPVVIHKDKHSDYGVMIPDIIGCYSAGSAY